MKLSCNAALVLLCLLGGCTATSQTAPAADAKTNTATAHNSAGEEIVKATALLESWLTQAGVPAQNQAEFIVGVAGQSQWPAAVATWVEKLNHETATQAYVVVNDRAARRIYLIGKTAHALKPAVYGYLHALGFRWYFPGEKWTAVPQNPDLFQVPNGLVIPAFIRRTMFGTGGMGPKHLPADPDLKVAEAWKLWQEQNRFGGEIVPTGHAGDQILSVAANRAVFEQHPEWRAMQGGQRVPMSNQFKFCHSNPEFQKWFVANRLQELERALTRNPDALGISVDPSDGGGHCECPECLKIGNGSVSDRVFLMANLTAHAVAEKFPGKRVGINAYNQHAAVPSYPLEPNIYVQIIPYAFQRTGLSPQELIAAWGRKKADNMGVYDYWSITDWAHCQPSLDYNRTTPAKVRLWHKNRLDGVGLESTYSAGAIGLQAYIAARLFWNINEDENALANEFFELMFGKAQVPMRRMLDRWAGEYRLTAQELALSYRDLDQAMVLAADSPAVQARIRDYTGYVFYLQRMLQFQETKPGDKLQAALQWLNAIWGIHESGMVQSYRMHMLIANRLIGGTYKDELQKNWPHNNPKAPAWSQWKPLDATALDRILKAGLDSYPVLYQPAFYTLDKLRPLNGDAAHVPEWVTTGSRFAAGRFLVWRDKPASPIQINIGNTPLTVKVTITRYNDSNPLHQQDYGPGSNLDLPVPAEPGIYQIIVRPAGTVSYALRARPDAHLTALGSVEVRQPASTTAFFVAPGQKKVVLHLPGNSHKTQFFDGDNKPVQVNDGVLKVIPVPPGQDGKIWSLRGYNGNRTQPITFLNGPRVYGFSRTGILVPENPVALDEATTPTPDANQESADEE